MRLVWNLIEYFKSYSFRRQFRIQFATVLNVILLALLADIAATSRKLGEVWLRTSKIINEISVKFEWVFLKVIPLDVNSDVNSQPFSMIFCRHHRLLLRQLSCKLGKVWLSTSKIINEISVKFEWVFLKVIPLDVNSDVNSQPFPMIFCRHHRLLLRQLPCKLGEVWLSTSKIMNEISVKFDWVF